MSLVKKVRIVLYFNGVILYLGSGEDVTKSKVSGAYQMMPKVAMGRKSHTDELLLYKGESRLLPREITCDFLCVFARVQFTFAD